MRTEIELPFGDGVYRFRLGMREILELERKREVGIGALHARLLRGRFVIGGEKFGAPDQAEYRIGDVVEVIRQGLIGGGHGTVDGIEIKVSPATATALIETYLLGPDRQPLGRAWDLAVGITGALVTGYDDGSDKKKDPEQADPKTTGSTAPSS